MPGFRRANHKSISITGFWRRWHISLSQFLKKYIYIPLGGSRSGIWKTCLNTMIVFLISGLWHGANWTFILWGASYGLFICLERLFRKWLDMVPRFLRWLAAFLIVNVEWTLFRADSVASFVQYAVKLLSFQNLHLSGGIVDCFELTDISIIELFIPYSAASHLYMKLGLLALLLMVSMILCFATENNGKRTYSFTKRNAALMAALLCLCLFHMAGAAVFEYQRF